MKRFAELYWELDGTTKSGEKLAAIQRYFREAAGTDAAWAIYFLMGQRLQKIVVGRILRQWAAQEAGIADWLFDECYERVGDIAETVALLLPPPAIPERFSLTQLTENELIPLRGLEETALRLQLHTLFQRLPDRQRLLTLKLITGELRVGVSRQILLRGLSAATGVDVEVLAGRLMGQWQPADGAFEHLIAKDVSEASDHRPFPFCLAHPLGNQSPDSLGEVADWQFEWKWDGIRLQLLARTDQAMIWSRGEEIINDAFPEMVQLGSDLPRGTVLDGELLAWDKQRASPLPFAQLQKRLGRKKPSKKLQEEVPVVLLAFDVLELQGTDLRLMPLVQRREKLEELVAATSHPRLQMSPLLVAKKWEDLCKLRSTSREQSAEGLMIKRRDSTYKGGRTRGVWWKWKIDPMTIDAVLVYAQGGSGRRASLFTDYTFAVWKDDELVPIAKAYSGLSDEEIHQVDAFVRRNTIEKFGPVCRVVPELVFELAFEGIQRSSRHKAGFAVRFPRILRWRQDKRPSDADHIARLVDLMEGVTASPDNSPDGTRSDNSIE